MAYAHIRLPDGRLTPFGPAPALDRAVVASALHANPNAGEALALAANVVAYFREHRAELESFAALIVDMGNLLDGDPDFEEDDPPGQCDEDEMNTNLEYRLSDKPGCRISDHEDVSATEWHTRGNRKLDAGIYRKDGWLAHEDDEETEPLESNGDERDAAWCETLFYSGCQPATMVCPGETEDDEDNHDREECY